MKLLKKLQWAMLFVAVSFLSVACFEQTDEAEPLDFDTTQDDSLADSEYNDVDALVSTTLEINDLQQKSATAEGDAPMPCATVTLDSEAQLITIDFGTENTVCNDGRVRRGQILVSYTGRYYEEGSVTTITFQGYHVNDHRIEGVRTATNLGQDQDGNWQHRIVVSNGRITTPAGRFITREADRVRTAIRGESADFSDDEVIIDGTASGSNRNGRSYTMETTTPIRYKRDCSANGRRFTPVSGVKVVSPQGRRARTTDFGDGACDNAFTVTIGENTYEVNFGA